MIVRMILFVRRHLRWMMMILFVWVFVRYGRSFSVVEDIEDRIATLRLVVVDIDCREGECCLWSGVEWRGYYYLFTIFCSILKYSGYCKEDVVSYTLELEGCV